jgi:hypothetical protein
MKRFLKSWLLVLGYFAALAVPGYSAPAARAAGGGFAELPMQFERNRGQTSSGVQFLFRGESYTLFLGSHEATLAFSPKSVLRIQMTRANTKVTVQGEEKLPGISNYFIGNVPNAWVTGIPQYGRVRFGNVYRGIDLVYYGTGQQFECDFVVGAGASPRSIRFRLNGAKEIRLDRSGNLLMHVGDSELRLSKPVAYQPGLEHRLVSAEFVLLGGDEVGFRLGAYDRHQPLVIDPILNYSTSLGGAGAYYASSVAVDSAGNMYIAGVAQNGICPIPGGFAICTSVFVVKVSADGSSVLYRTHLGTAAFFQQQAGIAVDATGNAYITGRSTSGNFPTVGASLGNGVVFAAKLSSDGSSLLYSTFLGRANSTPVPSSLYSASGIAVDTAGNAYVTGMTLDPQFPVVNAPGSCGNLSGNNALPFAIKINPSASDVTYARCVSIPLTSGSFQTSAPAVDAAGNAYITGGAGGTGTATDVFAVKLTSSGATAYLKVWGGSDSDFGSGIAVDAAGNAYVVGSTASTDYPVLNAFQNSLAPPLPHSTGTADAFVTRLDPQGSIIYSTYLGGGDSDSASAVAIDSFGNTYVTGSTKSPNFPTASPAQASLKGTQNVFVAVLNPAGSALLFSTYLGGSATDSGYAIALDGASNIYVAGLATSADFPMIRALQNILNPGNSNPFLAQFASIFTADIIPLPAGSQPPATAPLPIPVVETGAIRDGYLVVTPDPNTSTPLVTLTFGTVSSGLVLSQAAILPTAMSTSTSIDVDTVPAINRNVGVAIANPGNSDAIVTLQLRAQDGTPVGASVSIVIPATQQLAHWVAELFPSIGQAFEGSLDIQSPVAVSVIGLRFSGAQFSTLPVPANSPSPVPTRSLGNGSVGGPSAVIFPQFAISGGWATTLGLLNNSSTSMSGRIDIFDSTGNPMSVNLNGVTKSTFTYALPPHGSGTLAPRDSNGQSPF